MKENIYSSKTISFVVLWTLILLFPAISKSQVTHTNVTSGSTINVTPGLGNIAEKLWQTGEANWKNSMLQVLATDESSLNQFLAFNQSVYFKDRNDFFNGILGHDIGENNADQFFNKLTDKYIDLWKTEGSNYTHARPSPVIPPVVQAACNPSCYNISFQDGTLKGWSAWWAVNSSTTAAPSFTSKTGGLCGSITNAGGPDPNTGNSYHVTLMPATGNDVIAGGFVPYKPPMGGRSVMIGDGPNVNFGLGILEQTYLVDTAAPILTVQYAVLLENPGHTGYEQPWFKVEVLDQTGNPIPGCGQYFVVAAANLPGFKSISYGGGTVFCRPWTTAIVPLYNYVGQCITVRFTAADCGQGGHFGYAYVSSTCEKLDLIPSSTGFCIGQQSATIKGPAGDPSTTYQWTTPNGCISLPSNAQTVKVTCAGTYSLVMSSGGACVDTFSMALPAIPYGPPPKACFTSTKVCSGKPTAFDATCSNPNTNVKFYWDFYNSGNFDDSSGAKPTWVYSSGGIYPVRLHVQDANGCGADTTINVIVDSTYTGTMPTITITSTNVSACGQCNASITITIKSPSQNSAVTNDYNTRKFTAGGTSTGTGWTAGGTSISSSCINNVCSYTTKITYTAVCAGFYNFFFNPAVSANPGPCNNGGILYDTIPIFVGATGVNITGNINSSAASCGKNNGTATISGVGGTPGYTYSWSNPNLGTGPSKTGLAPGIYNVQITDAAGCLGVVKVTIGNFTALSAQVVPFDLTCYGSNDGSVKVTPSAGVAPFTYSWSPNVSTTDSAGALAAGTYTVFLTDNGGCTGSVTAVVKEPTKVIAVVNSCTCNVNCGQTGSAVVGASGGWGPYLYKWTNGTITPSVSGLQAGTSYAVVTDAFGCKDSVPVLVTINNGPQVHAIPPPPICIGATATLSGTTATGISYSWSPAPVGGCVTCLNTTTAPTTTTKYTLTVKDATGCSSFDTVTVTVNQLPTVVAGPASTICVGNSVTLTAGGASTYSWSTGQSATASILVAPPTGNYTYTVVGIDQNLCVNVATTTVLVNPLPIVPMSPPQSICLGASATITASGGVGYSWSTNQSGIGLTSISVTPPVGINSYTVTVVDVNGCINDSNTTVTVNPLANVTISPYVSLCPGSSTTLTAGGGVTYVWSTTQTGSSILVTPPATTTYSVAVTDANGCKGSDTVTVIINPQLTMGMSPDPTICIGKSTQLTASATGGTVYTYTWTPSGAGLNLTNIQMPLASPTVTTTYSVEINDVAGCTGDTVVTVYVNPLPPIVASHPLPICIGASTSLTASGGTSYVWNGTQSTAVITVTPPVGLTSYTVVGVDGNGCVNMDTSKVLVFPLPTVGISPQYSVCLGAFAQITAAGGNFYSWSNGLTGQSISVTPKVGSNTYNVTVTDLNGCVSSKSTTVLADAPPTATTSGTGICVGQHAQLTSAGGQNYSWIPPLYLSNPNSSNPVASPPFTMTYTVITTNTILCPPAFATATVTVSPAPTVTTSPDTAILAGNSVQLTSVGNGMFYNWSPTTGLSCANCLNPLASPLQTTMYIITTTDQYGCQNVDTVVIKVDDILTLYVPTAFTPYNYDNSNNVFYAYGVGIYQFEFYIYDRWGTLIFKTNDPYVGWDGSYNGKVVQSDVYVWLARAVSITGKTISKTGPVTVVH